MSQKAKYSLLINIKANYIHNYKTLLMNLKTNTNV